MIRHIRITWREQDLWSQCYLDCLITQSSYSSSIMLRYMITKRPSCIIIFIHSVNSYWATYVHACQGCMWPGCIFYRGTDQHVNTPFSTNLWSQDYVKAKTLLIWGSCFGCLNGSYPPACACYKCMCYIDNWLMVIITYSHRNIVCLRTCKVTKTYCWVSTVHLPSGEVYMVSLPFQEIGRGMWLSALEPLNKSHPRCKDTPLWRPLRWVPIALFKHKSRPLG